MSIEKTQKRFITERLIELIEEHAGGKSTVFARNTGIPPSTFQYYRQGRIPKWDHTIRICDTCNVSIDWFLTGRTPKRLNEKTEEGKSSKYLINIEIWLGEIVEQDPRKKDWFELHFEKSFPEFTFWLKKREKIGQDNQHKQVA